MENRSCSVHNITAQFHLRSRGQRLLYHMYLMLPSGCTLPCATRNHRPQAAWGPLRRVTKTRISLGGLTGRSGCRTKRNKMVFLIHIIPLFLLSESFSPPCLGRTSTPPPPAPPPPWPFSCGLPSPPAGAAPPPPRSPLRAAQCAPSALDPFGFRGTKTDDVVACGGAPVSRPKREDMHLHILRHPFVVPPCRGICGLREVGQILKTGWDTPACFT